MPVELNKKGEGRGGGGGVVQTWIHGGQDACLLSLCQCFGHGLLCQLLRFALTPSPASLREDVALLHLNTHGMLRYTGTHEKSQHTVTQNVPTQLQPQ